MGVGDGWLIQQIIAQLTWGGGLFEFWKAGCVAAAGGHGDLKGLVMWQVEAV
jgi:hypothetical protein